MNAILVVLLSVAAVDPGWQQVDSYEGNSFPDDEGWTRAGTFDMARWIDGGSLNQYARLCDGCPGPAGQSDTYGGTLTQFASVANFFVEFVVETTGQADFVHTAPIAIAIGNQLDSLYHFVIGNDQARFARDALVPFVFIDIRAGVRHRYRLELFDDVVYFVLVDDELVDAGTPEDAFFPGFNPGIAFATRYYGEEHITRLDYIRFGPIPISGSMDFDSDGLIGSYDHFLFVDYLTGPQIPHARGWGVGDVDGDADIDLLDFAALENAFTGDE